MGAFKDDLSEQDKKYGEAIIEVRNIKNVGHWFLKKSKLPSEMEGNFLKNPDGTLIEQSIKLFNFLKEFGTWLDIDDITLGMIHAGFRY